MKKFWIVVQATEGTCLYRNTQGNYKFTSKSEAMSIAEKLARKTQRTFIVLSAVDYVTVEVPVTWKRL